jgi:putative membrane protein
MVILFTLKIEKMFYNNYYVGMHFVWWFIWGIMLFWIFATPYDIPGQRRKRDTPLDILKQRYAAGQLTTTEYEERKKVLENDMV